MYRKEYSSTEYDWRKIEARMNALPQFITEIGGLDRGGHYAAWEQPQRFSEELRGLQITAVTCGKVGSMSCDRMFLKQQQS